MVSYMTPQGQTYMVPSPTPVSSVPRGHFSDFVRRVEVSRLRPTPHAHGAHVRITGTHIHTCARGHPVHVCAHTHTHTHTQACTHTWRAPACIVPEGLLFELFAAQQGQRLISHLLLLHEHMQVHARTHAHTHTHSHRHTTRVQAFSRHMHSSSVHVHAFPEGAMEPPFEPSTGQLALRTPQGMTGTGHRASAHHRG